LDFVFSSPVSMTTKCKLATVVEWAIYEDSKIEIYWELGLRVF